MTQVVGADEGYIVHNRLTHSLKVAQVGRRICEKLLQEQEHIVDSIGGLDPDVVESACLAHDLGHPPFGHIAEEVLCQVVEKANVPDGFEGNAQSFRILVKLAVRSTRHDGLNLTRATLDAVLKYPWFRETQGKRHRKYGAYRTEEKEFNWVREGRLQAQKSAEAEIMDWADDIAYSIHDVEDFYRAGLIPLDRLSSNDTAQEKFLDWVFDVEQIEDGGTQAELIEIWEDLSALFPREPFNGSRSQRAMLRVFTSDFIQRYVDGISLREPSGTNQRLVDIDERLQSEVMMLKNLTRHFAISNPALASQQHGQRKIIRDLFDIFLDSLDQDRAILPLSCRDQLEQIKGNDEDAHIHKVRLVTDLIASMTEQQALRTYQKLIGVGPGSGLDRFLHQSIS